MRNQRERGKPQMPLGFKKERYFSRRSFGLVHSILCAFLLIKTVMF